MQETMRQALEVKGELSEKGVSLAGSKLDINEGPSKSEELGQHKDPVEMVTADGRLK
jgi:hypothetical protein